eukprot:TCONS_00047945-protein
MTTDDNNVYQVIGNYEVVDTGKNEYLVASKGDIIIDCERVDDNWFRGKNIRSGTYGLIPTANVVSVQQNEYREIEPELVEKLHEEGVALTTDDADTTLDDAEDRQLLKKDQNPSSTTSRLARLGEGNYVDMSSEETLNCIDEEDEETNNDEKIPLPKRSPLPKPPRHPSVSETSKANDEGYNSASHYSGENNDSKAPLLNDNNRTNTIPYEDEAGYEVPKINPSHELENDVAPPQKIKQRKKKKSLMMLWKGKHGEPEAKVQTAPDEAHQNYYDPPADIRDNYFLPYSKNPTVRVALSFIAALGISVTLFLVLLLLTKLHPVLCFSVATVIFIVLLVVPVTLYHRGIFCVIMLLFPSLFGYRCKIVAFMLLIVFLILGPVFGTADKIHIARSCANNEDFFYNSTVVSGTLQDDCMYKFGRIADTCSGLFNDFNRSCRTWSTPKDGYEQFLCNQTKDFFCQTKKQAESICASTTIMTNTYNEKLEVTYTLKNIVFYLLPFLALMVLAEAYNYNKVYLTTKNKDNIYITQRLRELDTERRNRGLTDLILPLTRIELYTYLVRGNVNTTKAERNRIYKWLVYLLVMVFITVCLVLIENHVDILLTAVLTKKCLAHYEQNNHYRYRVVIYALLGTTLFIILMQSHVLRLRSVVCDYIYPEMVETRSKHLYYKILHDRHAFARHVRRKIQLLSEEKRLRLRISFFSKIYNVLPTRLQWVCDKFTVRTCMICDSLSYRKTVECNENSCRAHYCFECHVDAGQNCLTCKVPTPTSRNSTVPAPRSSFCV